MAAKIKKNDLVIILVGKDKNKTGTIIQVSTNNNKVLVSGINMIKKHKKPIPEKNQQGGIVEQESFLHISNVAILNPQTNKPDRVGFRIENGKKVRFLKSNNVTYK